MIMIPLHSVHDMLGHKSPTGLLWSTVTDPIKFYVLYVHLPSWLSGDIVVLVEKYWVDSFDMLVI